MEIANSNKLKSFIVTHQNETGIDVYWQFLYSRSQTNEIGCTLRMSSNLAISIFYSFIFAHILVELLNGVFLKENSVEKILKNTH